MEIKSPDIYSFFVWQKKNPAGLLTSCYAKYDEMKCPVRVIWVYRQTRYVALMTTDLTLSVEQIIEFYGARWRKLSRKMSHF